MKIIPVILCGGSGTRLWPLSRNNFPKQFLNLFGNLTLFQESVARAVALKSNEVQVKKILIITNENHRFLALEQLDELKLNTPTQILLEPESKNTAPALTLSALAAEEIDKNSVLVVFPADHYVKDKETFVEAIHEAINAVVDKNIITLGIKPTHPDTGFGYMQYEGDSQVKKVLSFKEKPDMITVQNILKQGNHAWNSGIFILRPQTWLDAINKINAPIYLSVLNAWKIRKTDQWFVRPSVEFFKQSPSDSIDYAVIEKFKKLNIIVNLVMIDVGWSDLGSFDKFDEVEKKDNNGNIFKGDIISFDTKNTTAISSKKNISLLGVENLIVIDAGDTVLIANKNDSQSLRDLIKILQKNHRYLLNEHNRVNRPWGWYETVDLGKNYKVKKIEVKPGAKLSYQSHKFRNEHWVVVKGKATIICDGKKRTLNPDESTYIKMGVKHQLINQEKETLNIIEVQTGKKVIEEDIVRFEDVYGRKISK